MKRDVTLAQTDVIDYTDQLIIEPFAENVKNKYCVRNGNMVTVNFECKMPELQGTWIRLALLPQELWVGSGSSPFDMLFTAHALTKDGNLGGLVAGKITGKTISVLQVSSNVTYCIGITFINKWLT